MTVWEGPTMSEGPGRQALHGSRHEGCAAAGWLSATHLYRLSTSDANLKNPKDYWDYENLTVEWG